MSRKGRRRKRCSSAQQRGALAAIFMDSVCVERRRTMGGSLQSERAKAMSRGPRALSAAAPARIPMRRRWTMTPPAAAEYTVYIQKEEEEEGFFFSPLYSSSVVSSHFSSVFFFLMKICGRYGNILTSHSDCRVMNFSDQQLLACLIEPRKEIPEKNENLIQLVSRFFLKKGGKLNRLPPQTTCFSIVPILTSHFSSFLFDSNFFFQLQIRV